MSDVTPPPAAPAAPPSPPPAAAPMQVLRAITDPMRHAVLRELADGSHPSLTVLARRLDCHPDMMGRHLRRMQKAGLVVRVRPADADLRSKFYQIPAAFRSTAPDGRRVLDFGCCLLRFPAATPA